MPTSNLFTPKTRYLLPALLMTLISGTVVTESSYSQSFSGKPFDYTVTGDIELYAQYTKQGRVYFEGGQLTKAIEFFEKALRIAPKPSLPVIYNNLAVAYIRRGNYFLNSLHQNETALSDFRMASFYLDATWLDSMERNDLHQKNSGIATNNILAVYENLHKNPKDITGHINMAKALRSKGKFAEAIVEYRQVLDLSPQNTVAIKALGDLYTVVNIPEKAQVYYALLIDAKGEHSGLSADNYVTLGNAQYKAGKIEEAVKNYDKALTIQADNQTALNMLEKIWLDEVKFNPASVLGHANLGGVYQKKKAYDQAYQQYSAAEHFAEQNRSTDFNTKKLIRLNMGTLFQEQHRYQPAIKAYDTVLQVDPNHLLANYYKATLLEETGNLGGAIGLYNKVLSIDSAHVDSRERVLALIRKDSNHKRSGIALQEFANRFSNDATIQAQIGEEFHQRKELTEAAVLYERAIHINPSLASAWANLGAVYQEQGNLQKSRIAFDKAVELEPDNDTFKQLASQTREGEAYADYQKAVALQNEGRSEEAIIYFKKALAINETAEMLSAYGISLQSSGDLDNAILNYKKALAKSPDNPDYLYYTGTAYHQKKEYQQAKSFYEKTLKQQPDYKTASEALASINTMLASQDLDAAIQSYESKQYATALSALDKVLRQDSQNAVAHYYKGLTLEAQKKIPQAVQSYQLAVLYDDQFSDAYYALGVALDSQKRQAEAISAFKQFIQLSGTQDDDFVRYAKDRVKAMQSVSM